MIKKEFTELKKIISKKDCRINRIAWCYVDGEKNIIMSKEEAFHQIGEEESFKYCDLFKKILSGTPGKSLVPLAFDNSDAQDALLKVAGNRDEKVRDALYRKIIDNLRDPENYLILIAYGDYDVPYKATDGKVLEDSSDEVYSFMLCAICPVPLAKPGLCYSDEKSQFTEKFRNREIGLPVNGFLYPAFNNRSADVNEVELYTKKTNTENDWLIRDVLGCKEIIPADTQNEAFWEAVSDYADYTYENALAIDRRLKAKIAESDANEESPVYTADDAGYALRAYIKNPDAFSEKLSETIGDTELQVPNLTEKNKVIIQNDDLKLQVTNNIELLETKIIDGHEYLMIPITNGLCLNGIPLKQRKE